MFTSRGRTTSPLASVVKLSDEYTSESKYRFGFDGLHPFWTNKWQKMFGNMESYLKYVNYLNLNWYSLILSKLFLSSLHLSQSYHPIKKEISLPKAGDKQKKHRPMNAKGMGKGDMFWVAPSYEHQLVTYAATKTNEVPVGMGGKFWLREGLFIFFDRFIMWGEGSSPQKTKAIHILVTIRMYIYHICDGYLDSNPHFSMIFSPTKSLYLTTFTIRINQM